MGGPGSLLTRLRGVLAAFDDEALAGLASKGLVRRAQGPGDDQAEGPRAGRFGGAASRGGRGRSGRACLAAGAIAL